MKTAKKLLLILLALMLTLSFVACSGGGDAPCTEHKDDNADGICDVCEEEIESEGGGDDGNESLKLIENGAANFQFVLQTGIPATVRTEFLGVTKSLENLGFTVELVADREDTKKEGVIDIVIGDVVTRGNGFKDYGKRFGPSGYGIEVIDGMLVVSGGSEDALIDAVEVLLEDVLKIDSLTSDSALVIEKANNVEKHHTGYRLDSLSINGTLANEHIIITDMSDESLLETALLIQSTFYKNVGYWCEIHDAAEVSEVPEKAIVLKVNEEVRAQGGFKLTLKDSQFIVETVYPLLVPETVKTFLDTNVTLKRGDLNITKSLNMTKEQRYVNYEQFGAIGEGYKNDEDFPAIVKAHDYANKNGHIVKTAPGKIYYIGKTYGNSAIIKTDVIWGDTKFIIDDLSFDVTASTERSTCIFKVVSDYSQTLHKSSSELVQSINQAIKDSNGTLDFTKLTKFFDYAPGYDVMIFPTDDNHKVYIRYGGNANDGQSQSEAIVLDKDGNIHENTPFLLNYNNISYIKEYRVDDTPITISGGLMVTIANAAPRAYTYYDRNISISRSNTILDGLVHQIEGEGDTGAPYSGFISVGNCNHVTIQNITVQAHRWYFDEQTYLSSMGTYELSGGSANDITYINCNQSNFYDPHTGKPTSTWFDKDGNTGYRNNTDGTMSKALAGIWGVHGSNYCKNITYIDCVLNRYDAHAGLYNGTIKGCEIISINLVGGGTALIEDTTVYASNMITLRSDYGSTWNGDLYIRDVTWVSSATDPYMISGGWSAHYFGYDIYLPRVIVENLTFQGNARQLYVFNNYGTNEDISDPKLQVVNSKGETVDNPNPLVFSPEIIINNCGDIEIAVAPKGSKFNRTPIIRDGKKQ